MKRWLAKIWESMTKTGGCCGSGGCCDNESEAVRILHNRYIKGDPKRIASLAEERKIANLKQKIYDLLYKLRMEEGFIEFKDFMDELDEEDFWEYPPSWSD